MCNLFLTAGSIIFVCHFIEIHFYSGDIVANIKSAKKRAKTNAKRRMANRQVKSAIRTTAKKALAALDPANPNHANLLEIQKEFIRTVDSAAQKGVIKKETAARKKSRLALKVNKLRAQA